MSQPAIHYSTVNAFYLAFYGRPADPAGMKYWAEQLAKANGDLNAIKAAFANSTEAQVRFGEDSAAERITQIYEQLFDRAPEAGGLAYWVEVISKGHASVADVAIEVLRGAQGGDLKLSSLRQEAVEKFTAAVEASGAGYDGIAAVEAARVLVRAVTPAASKADLDALVKSTTTLTDVATTSPEAVAALGSGEEMLALFETGAGGADPVALVESLAETARGASADAHAMASLKRGGGMKKLLEALPEGMTLKDLIATLGKGGLPAAIKALNLDIEPGKPGKPGKPGSGDGGATGFEFHLADNPSKLVVKAATGLANAEGLTLEDAGSGTPQPTKTDYTGAGMTASGNALSFDGQLDAGLYRMGWTAGTFASADGQLAAGSALFAGGRDGLFVQEGFAVAASTTLSGDLSRSSTEQKNEAFIGVDKLAARVATGGGQDVVVDNGATLTIVVEKIDAGAADLILGFDSGNDKLALEGAAGSTIDDNADGKLSWSASATVDAAAEAVAVNVSGQIVLGAAAGLSQTLASLNEALEVGALASGEDLLILATDAAGSGAALFLYVNKDDDDQIDADELTQLAAFADGAPGQDDIVLVGVTA